MVPDLPGQLLCHGKGSSAWTEWCWRDRASGVGAGMERRWGRHGAALEYCHQANGGAPSTPELGAFFDGNMRIVGPSGSRLLRLLQSTLLALGKPGRWQVDTL